MTKAEIVKAANVTFQALWSSGNKPSPTRFYYRMLRVMTKEQLRYFLNDSNFNGIDPLNETEARSVLCKDKGAENVE